MQDEFLPYGLVLALGVAFSLGALFIGRSLAPWGVLLAFPIVVFTFFFLIRHVHPSEVAELATGLWVSYLMTGLAVIGLQWLFHF